MEENIIKQRIDTFLTLRLKEEGSINAMMCMELQSYDSDKRTVTLTFPVSKWQLNPAGTMHGGLISTALDIAMGCVAYAYSDASFTPTIHLDVNFNKAIKEDDIIVVKAYCDHAGKRMAQTRAVVLISKDEDYVVASANGSYAINHKE